MKSQFPELLSPAGDLERLTAAVRYGADAVYLGGKQFGMRAASENFDPDGLKSAVDFCHKQGVKVYLTCNTLPREEDLDALPDSIRAASDASVDALIVADVGVLMLAKRVAPELSLHISTQAGVVNHLAAAEFHQMGASRVILARELSLDEIRRIRENTPPALEIEAFVHGAMCMSFSGRCLLSNYLTGRDGNRGQCAQPCRWSYRLLEEKRPGEYYAIQEEDGGTFLLNAKDLCMLPYLDQLADAGISSFKIEGRAKSVYYVAVVTGAYRMALDHLRQNPERYDPPAWLLEEVEKVSHRRYNTGFYFPEQPPGQFYGCRGYIRDWEVVATVDGWEDGFLLCSERNRFQRGETFELIQPGEKPVPITAERIFDEEGAPLETANHPMMKLRIPWERPCPAGAILRRQKELS